MKHKKQHYVPRSYLQAWCDPRCPPGQTPYVWVFPKDGNQGRKKSPEKIFRETDMYTVHADDGQRDLTLETNLAAVESKFSKLRRNKLNRRVPFSPQERLYLCMFVAAMYGRTKAFGEHWSGQWRRALDMLEKVHQAWEAASEEQRANMEKMLSPLEGSEEDSLSMEEVHRLVEQPIQESLSDIVLGMSPLLFEMPFVILEASHGSSFITSDAPCVLFDPANYQQPKSGITGGLQSPTIEVTLPLSPKQMLWFGNKLIVSGIYIANPDLDIVEALNQRTRIWAHEYVIADEPKARAA